MEFWKKTMKKKTIHAFERFEKNHEEQDHNFEVSTIKKKTIAMEFWKKTRKKKTMPLGALEKTMKNKTTTMEFLKKARKRRPQLWELWKKQ
jgi:hypothetical protein